MWPLNCGRLKYNRIVVSEMQINEQLHIPDITVTFGITAVVVACVQSA